MKPPVEHVRVSAKGKEILIKVKKRTGLEHWNEICRLALCISLANPNHAVDNTRNTDSALDIEWKTFAGQYHEELTALVFLRAQKDGVKFINKDSIMNYFRAHLERGIASLQNLKDLTNII